MFQTYFNFGKAFFVHVTMRRGKITVVPDDLTCSNYKSSVNQHFLKKEIETLEPLNSF